MAKISVEPKFTLRLIVDEEKKKVVLAEACRDFVDVLFSLLTLPMGTIIRLLKIHRKSEIGCFTNLYKSVVDMSIDDFETETCKQMLLYPRSVREVQCNRLKVNINPTQDIKCFQCSRYCSFFSNFSTSRCRCGALTSKEIQLENEELLAGQTDDANGVFVNGRCSFIITDDLKVAVIITDDFKMQLPSIITQQPPVYYRYRLYSSNQVEYGLTTNGNRTTNYHKDGIVKVNLMDPKSSGKDQSRRCYGFLKKATKFTVLDDLTITSMNSCSTVCLLKKLQSHADNLEVQVISITKTEALNLLRASLVTSSALSTALWSLIAKKPKEETDLCNPVSKKLKEVT
ncbi:unnamed protein product [Arabis nemorensis]|uniref:DUF674 family protein n=1 Tax=Arabis nemorensis TaxID=586526 RepID=A0A565CH20_9BRAS|nr:unnamed protein product [Arabis nemorensis]